MKEFNLSDELEKEQERLEDEINECECENKTGFAQLELGRCGICDVRFAKHEGIRFAGEKVKEFIKLLKDKKKIRIMEEDEEEFNIDDPRAECIDITDLDKLAGQKLVEVKEDE